MEEPARVINIGSIDGIGVPALETYSYSASKAAVHQLTRHLAKRLAPTITVNAIAPGPFESKMMAATLEAFGDQIEAGAPLKRIGRPDDMAGAAIFLASRAGAYLTGADHPGRRRHRHHPIEGPTGDTPCCCSMKCTGSPGPKKGSFDAAYRDELLPALAKSDGCRLLWYLRPGPRQRPGLHRRHHHRLPGRRGVGGAGRARARRRPGGVVGQGRRHAAHVRRQDRPAGVVVAAAGDRPRHACRSTGRDPQELAVHGGHGLALRRRAPGLPRTRRARSTTRR